MGEAEDVLKIPDDWRDDMTTGMARQDNSEIIEKIVVEGDLSKLSASDRVKYYIQTCESLGLNPLTRPFEYIRLSGKLTLYAKKDATEQLTRKQQLSIRISDGVVVNDAIIYRATASDAVRAVDATGVVDIKGLKGDNLANAMMKAETKASRRAVLRFSGLGWLDETETETIPSASIVQVNPETGELPPAPAPAKKPQQAQTEAKPFVITPAFNWPRFWATCKDKLNLESDDVHKILGVDSVKDYVAANNIESAKELFEKVENLHTAATVFGPPDGEPDPEAAPDPIEPVSAVEREEVLVGRELTDQEKKYTFLDSTWLTFTSGIMDKYDIDTNEMALVFVKGFTGDMDPVTYCRERLVNLSELLTRIKKSSDDKPEWLEEIHSRQAEQVEQS